MNTDENGVELSNVGVDDEKQMEKSLVSKVKEASNEASILWEAVVDKTVTTINGSLAWMNAELLVVATTMSFNKMSDDGSEVLSGMWLYAVGLFNVLIIFTYCFEGALSYEDEPAEAKTITVNGDKEIVKVIERNFRQQKKAWSLLFVETMGIVIAIALRDAMMESIAQMTGSKVDPETGYYTNMKNDSGTLAAQVVYGFSVTFLSIYYISWLSSGPKDSSPIIPEAVKPKNQGRSVAARLQNEGMLKASQISIFTLLMSFAITDFIGVLIIHVAGKSRSAELLGTLAYAVVLTFGVIRILTVFDIYGMCIPMYSWQPFQIGSSERNLTGTAIVDALNKAVGLAWILFAKACFNSISNTDSKVAAAWGYAVVVVFITIFFALYGYKWILVVQAEVSGYVEFIKENLNSAYVPDREDENEEENPEKDFWYFWRAQAAETYLAATGVITGMAIADAGSLSLRIYYETEDKDEDAYLRNTWILSIGTLVFSAILSVYLGSLVQKVMEKRREIVSKVRGLGN